MNHLRQPDKHILDSREEQSMNEDLKIVAIIVGCCTVMALTGIVSSAAKSILKAGVTEVHECESACAGIGVLSVTADRCECQPRFGE